MKNIVEFKLREWTTGLTPEESRVRIFEKIRDIPFAIVLEQFKLADGPKLMLKNNRGFCISKHYFLGMMFSALDIPVRYCTYAFKWQDQDLDYTEELKELSKDLPIVYHLACEINISSGWVLVDGTWDKALDNKKFPVNMNWDGCSTTRLAVIPIEKFTHEDIQNRETFSMKKLSSYKLEEELKLSRFSIGLNKWLEDIRIRGQRGRG
ncbi:MAG: hypothetical protein KAI70_01285 [Candidatus Omnitrophica bacterium]|nr:hypothetical protein [Candidatus Omnitrophota bacterium]